MKKLSFTLLAIAGITLAAATFAEKYRGTEFVQTAFYGSWWFVLLWAALAVSAVCYLLQRKLQKNVSAFLLHSSFVVILAGALLTALTARHGSVHLRINDPVTDFVTEDAARARLPFTVNLDTFQVSYYPGTTTPADYTSRITVKLPTGETLRAEVSMNRIFTYGGMRFYQSSYDSDGQGSLLAVNDDRWGIPVTYGGYFLLFLAMIWNLFSPQGYFRRSLRHPLLKKGGVLGVFLLAGLWAKAAERTLPRADAAFLSEAQVLYNGRIAPVQTLASDFTLKLTGKTSFKNYSCEQVLLGWLLFPASWNQTPMIRVKDAALRRALGLPGEYACLKDFFSPQGEYLPARYLNEPCGKLKKAAVEADEKVQLITRLQQGTLFQVFPATLNGHTAWYAPGSELPAELDDNRWLFIRKGLGLLSESVLKSDTGQIRFFISRLIAYQQKNAGDSLLPQSKVRAEIIYNRLPVTALLYKINLALGMLAFGYLCYAILRQRKMKKGVIRLFVLLLGLSFFTLTLYLVLRGYVSGRLPLGNGFETMMTLAWSVMLVTMLFCRKFGFVVPFGLLLSGFCLLVASLGQMNPQVTPLMPVLSSPLLSLHVSLIMMSYALFSFTFLNALLALVLAAGGKKSPAETLQAFSRVLLVPALFLLGAGIFTGAIWANVSWGRYWAWDPKETWALITFLVYAFALHQGSLLAFRKPLFFHAYLLLCFPAILMTYFGVNYFLGGMHSYA